MKKGFTLIELMIVIAIIGILSAVIIPKVGAIKVQSKNNGVESNALLVRSFLENRSGKDGIEYKSDISAGQTPEQALTTVLNNIGTDMTSNFTLSNALTNYFTNNNSINYSQGNVTKKSATTAAAVLAYYCTDTLPTDNNAVSSSTLPSGTGFSGDVISIVYGTGYVVYGVDNTGAMVNINIIKFPPAPPDSVSGVYPGDGGADAALQMNVDKVVSYLNSIAIKKILTAAPDNHIWDVMRTPLYSDLNNKFTPGNTSLDIVNPYHTGIDAIDNDTGWVDPTQNYAIIAYSPEDITQTDTSFSKFTGAVVVYITSNPLGYVVYGVDKNGNSVYKTQINLSTLVTSAMTDKLSSNVTLVYNTLKNQINYNVSQNGTYGAMQSLAYSELQGLNLNNAYVPDWTGIGKDTYDFYRDKGYSLVAENTPSDHVTDYKGSVIVDALSDGSGYDIYGMDWDGKKYADVKLTSTNSAVSANADEIIAYLRSLGSIDGNNKFSPQDIQTLLVKNFNTSIVNPYNALYNNIVIAPDSSINNQNSVIVCDNHTTLNYVNYKGDIIVKESNGSEYSYDVFGIGSDGTILPITTVSVK